MLGGHPDEAKHVSARWGNLDKSAWRNALQRRLLCVRVHVVVP